MTTLLLAAVLSQSGSPTVPTVDYHVCRIEARSNRSRSFATGVLVASYEQAGLVLTVSHLWDGTTTQVPLRITFPKYPRIGTIGGTYVRRDRKADLGLIRIGLPREFAHARVAESDPPVGSVVQTYGWNHGRRYEIWNCRVTAIDKYIGFGNLELSRQPVQGRSGGPGFHQGRLVAICSSADPSSRRGIYASASAIRKFLFPPGNTTRTMAGVQNGSTGGESSGLRFRF